MLVVDWLLAVLLGKPGRSMTKGSPTGASDSGSSREKRLRQSAASMPCHVATQQPSENNKLSTAAVVRKGERSPWLVWVLAEVLHDQVAVRKHHDAIVRTWAAHRVIVSAGRVRGASAAASQ